MTKQELSYLETEDLQVLAKANGVDINGKSRSDAEDAILKAVEAKASTKKAKKESAPKVRVADTLSDLRKFGKELGVETIDRVKGDPAVPFAISFVMPNGIRAAVFPRVDGNMKIAYRTGLYMVNNETFYPYGTATTALKAIFKDAVAENAVAEQKAKEEAEKKEAEKKAKEIAKKAKAAAKEAEKKAKKEEADRKKAEAKAKKEKAAPEADGQTEKK